MTAEVREEIETDTVERLRTDTVDLKQAINHTRSQLATAQSLKGQDLAPVLSGFAERVGPEARSGFHKPGFRFRFRFRRPAETRRLILCDKLWKSEPAEWLSRAASPCQR